MGLSGRERQKRLIERRKADGLVAVHVFVKKETHDNIARLAKEWDCSMADVLEQAMQQMMPKVEAGELEYHGPVLKGRGIEKG